ncbi:MAG TPA: TRAP transporter small permease [Arenimonas sp.]|uniref:TRAP transporter small permease n=1 Tax=Arenimonas sp. TaxID=1872635 RepID=UPI002D7F27DB|nr:TRAP transporter small permease [Arenimonas sp.]HEU0153738.1 TRAP transporter small permease [Arenimonas sp.]
MPQRWLDRLHRVEDALLAILLGALLLLSVAQIGLRLVFDSGLDWAEPVSRAGVLWLALLGALGATRTGKHIAIDALPRALPAGAHRPLWAIAQVAAAIVALWLAWLGVGLVALEREAPVPFVAGIPSWVPMLALPVGFGLMGLRFLVAACLPPPVVVAMGEGTP